MKELIAPELYGCPELTREHVAAVVATPVDQLQSWLLAHARCSLAGADVLALDPPRWHYGHATGLQGRCRRCGTETDLAFDLAGIRALDWWIGDLVRMVDEDRDLFMTAECQMSGWYWECSNALDRAIRFAVLLECAGESRACGDVH